MTKPLITPDKAGDYYRAYRPSENRRAFERTWNNRKLLQSHVKWSPLAEFLLCKAPALAVSLLWGSVAIGVHRSRLKSCCGGRLMDIQPVQHCHAAARRDHRISSLALVLDAQNSCKIIAAPPATNDFQRASPPMFDRFTMSAWPTAWPRLLALSPDISTGILLSLC